MKTIALFGAAGKIGTRISNRMQDDPLYRMLYVEAGEGGRRACGSVGWRRWTSLKLNGWQMW